MNWRSVVNFYKLEKWRSNKVQYDLKVYGFLSQATDKTDTGLQLSHRLIHLGT
jgi:hypothetical protein